MKNLKYFFFASLLVLNIACSSDDDNSTTSHNNSTSKSKFTTTAHTQSEWEQFFHSIFNEIISTGVNHTSNASTYRGSDVERQNVLHYYTMHN